MKHAVLLLVLLIAFNQKAFSDNNFSFDYDFCSFKDENSGKVFVELYYAFNQHQLKFIKTSDGYEAGGKLSVVLVNSVTGKTVINKMFKVPLSIKDTAGYDKNKKLVGQIDMLLDSGSYKLAIDGSDFNDTSFVMKRTEDIDLHGFSNERLCVSSIELASNITKSDDQKNIFYKNTLVVTPNPSLLFGNNMSSMYYYMEFYNLNKDVMGEKYTLNFSILDSKGNEDYSNIKNYKIISPSKVEIGSIDLSKFTTDKYKMSISLKNDAGDILQEASKIFYVFNPAVKDTNAVTNTDPGFTLSEFSKYDDKDVAKEYERLIYLITDIQKKQYDKLNTLDQKREFLYNFWKSRDVNPVKAHMEHLRRIEYANKNYRNAFLEGWKSDRGRVYVLYGPYDDIERHDFESQTRAYEIWTYNAIQGGAIFVFVDQSSGVGNFELVHSTAQNEIRDDNWQDKLNIRK
jgi:GWxTD domain-containing protein